MSAVAPELPGARVLDLFAGSGALGIEALSRGADAAVFVESDAGAVRVLRENLRSLEADGRADVVRGDALRYVEALEAGSFDVAFADPPYGQGAAAALLERFALRPFARLLTVEHGRSDPLPALPGLRTRRYGDTSLTFVPAEAP
jgi:16S rRNA (guanine966-N2)-methyltransferase